MSKISLIIDAWSREAEEASRCVEELESRIKLKDFSQSSILHSARSKLLELGVKLDRLESLLRNPPPKPILTGEDLDFRWKMLQHIQLRTRAVASNLYAAPSPNRPSNAPVADTKECNISDDCYGQDLTKTSCPQDNPELLKPLLSDGASRNQVQAISNSSMLMKACSIIVLFLGVAAVVFFIVLILLMALPHV